MAVSFFTTIFRFHALHRQDNSVWIYIQGIANNCPCRKDIAKSDGVTFSEHVVCQIWSKSENASITAGTDTIFFDWM